MNEGKEQDKDRRTLIIGDADDGFKLMFEVTGWVVMRAIPHGKVKIDDRLAGILMRDMARKHNLTIDLLYDGDAS